MATAYPAKSRASVRGIGGVAFAPAAGGVASRAMTHFARWLFAPALCLAMAMPGIAAARGTALTPAQAAQHIGATATVCGTVAGAHYAQRSDGEPTFINLDRPYPNPVFTIVIWGDYRDKFTPAPETWTGRVCATGKITSFHGKAEMKVFDPSQIQR